MPSQAAVLVVHSKEDTQLLKPKYLAVEYAVKTAIDSNPAVAAMQAQYDALMLVPPEVSALPDPTITFGAVNFPTDTFSRSQEPMTQLQIGFSQALPFPGKLDLKKQLAKQSALSAFHEANQHKIEVAQAVKIAWWQIHYIDRAIETLMLNKALMRQFIDVATTQYQAGVGSFQDVLVAKIELSKLKDKETGLLSQRVKQVIKLNYLMGRALSSPIVIGVQNTTTILNIISQEMLQKKAMESQPRLKKRGEQVTAAQTKLKIAQRDLYPDFNLSVNYGARSNARSDLVSIMVGVKIPLYAGAKQSKNISQSRFEITNQQHKSTDEMMKVKALIATYSTNYKRALQQQLLYEKMIIPQAGQVISSMLAQYQVNQIDFYKLVNMQMTKFEYELKYWQAVTHAHQALATLEAAVGEGNIYE